MLSCSVDACDAKHYAKTFCALHYKRWRAHGDPLMVKTPDRSAYTNADPEVRRAKLLAKTDRSSDCWVWLGTKTAAGYGQMHSGDNGRKAYTHRVAYELFVGPIPEGLVIDHLCRNRACCNPEHLEPVRQFVNAGIRSGRASRTDCRNGHPLAGANLRLTKAGHRVCVTCDRAYQKRKRDERRAAA